LQPHQGDFALAGRILADHWRAHPEQLRPVGGGKLTYDAAMPRRTRDQVPLRKMRLNGPANQYRIATDSDGSVWLEQWGEGAQTGVKLPRSSAELVNAAGPLPMSAMSRVCSALAKARSTDCAPVSQPGVWRSGTNPAQS
jgi:hypothetical protein